MRKHYFLLVAFIVLINSLRAQAPKIQWQKCFGGTKSENLSIRFDNLGDPSVKILSRDKLTFIVAGTTESTDGDVGNGLTGFSDIWVAKLDLSGNIIWSIKIDGGTYSDNLASIIETSDGSFLISGTANNEFIIK